MDVTSGPDPSSMTNDLVSDLRSLKPFLEAHHCRTDAIDRAIAAIEQHTGLVAENERLRAILNTPEVEDFARGAVLEAAHQRERWGADHDAGKTPFDWFWLIGYLSQKAASAAVEGNIEKALHHTISSAAALANWHLALSGADNRMVPGAPLPVIAAALVHPQGEDTPLR